MTTGLPYANITPKGILSYEDLGERHLGYLREVVRAHSAKAWLIGGVFGTTKATLAGSGTNLLKVTFAAPYAGGVDNSGHILTPLKPNGLGDESLGQIVEVPFENSNGVVYRVGYTYASIPRGIISNPHTAIPEFSYFLDAIGTKGIPDAVVDNGNGTITFAINSVCDRYGFTHSYAGRKCLIYLNEPSINANLAEVAIETCEVTWNGTQNRITTVGNFAQNATSLLAGNYTAVLLGPWISKNTTNSGLDDMFIGRITGNGGTPGAGDISNQNLINQSLSTLAANTYTGGPAWLDGTTNPTTQVNTQISKIITDLSTGNGSKKIASPARATWVVGPNNPATSVHGAIDKIITDLSSIELGNDGANKIATEDSIEGILTGVTVRQQLNELAYGAGLGKKLWGYPISMPVSTHGGQSVEFDGEKVWVHQDVVWLQNQPDALTLLIDNYTWRNCRTIYWEGNATQGNVNTIHGLNHPDRPPETHVVHFINAGAGALRFALQSNSAAIKSHQFLSKFNSVSNDYVLPSGAFILLVCHYANQWYLHPCGNATPGGV